MLLSANWALANEMGTSGREAQHIGIINLANIGGAGISKLLGPGIDVLNRLDPNLEFLGYSYTVTGYSAMLIGCGLMFVSGALLLMPLDSKKRGTQSSDGLPPEPT
jgi:Na+/phosphate symporter